MLNFAKIMGNLRIIVNRNSSIVYLHPFDTIVSIFTAIMIINSSSHLVNTRERRVKCK